MEILKTARWIGAEEAVSSPVIIRRFSLEKTHKAELTITGLGYFEAMVNGQPVTQYRLLPVPTDYEPRDLTKFLYPLQDQTHHRIYCYPFEITALLSEGENVLEIRLGNGFYRQKERLCEGETFFGNLLKTVYAIEAETEKGRRLIASDGSETWRESEIRDNNVFHGEVIDYTFQPGQEKPVQVLPAPRAELSPAIGAMDKIIRVIQPKLLGERDGKRIFDAGENLTGVVRMTTTAPAGSRTSIAFAEDCSDDLTLDFVSAGSLHVSASGRPQVQMDEFITDGEKRVFMPRFVWHAFRYLEVEGPFDELEICEIHSDVPVTSGFCSTLEGLQFLYDAYVRTQLCNMHGSYPSDCPHRERLGYTGDGQVCAPAAMMMLDSRAFYEKWIQDILDGQDPETGHVQHTAPLMGGGGGPGVWGAAIVHVPYAYWKQYGDRGMLETCYKPMLRWLEYLDSRSENGLVVREEEGGWCLGDWLTLEPIRISVPYVNTCCLVKMIRTVEEIARLLGRNSDLPLLAQKRARAEAAIRRTFYDASTAHYDVGDQGADAYAVWCGLEGPDMAERVSQFYNELGHFDTGFVGTDVLLDVLFRFGHADTAIRLLQSREMGSFLYMKDHGATTLWENWNGAESHNHPMFGAGARQLFEGVLGIRQREGTAGWREVTLQPCVPKGHRVSGSLLTPVGRLSVTVDCTGGKPEMTVEAPEGMTVCMAADPKTI